MEKHRQTYPLIHPCIHPSVRSPVQPDIGLPDGDAVHGDRLIDRPERSRGLWDLETTRAAAGLKRRCTFTHLCGMHGIRGCVFQQPVEPAGPLDVQFPRWDTLETSRSMAAYLNALVTF